MINRSAPELARRILDQADEHALTVSYLCFQTTGVSLMFEQAPTEAEARSFLHDVGFVPTGDETVSTYWSQATGEQVSTLRTSALAFEDVEICVWIKPEASDVDDVIRPVLPRIEA